VQHALVGEVPGGRGARDGFARTTPAGEVECRILASEDDENLLVPRAKPVNRGHVWSLRPWRAPARAV
jgi:hypothetical protein